jgi:subtilisin family serine protease
MMLVENPHYNNHTRRAHGKGNHCGELVDIIGCGHGAAEYKAHATDYAGILLYGGLFTMSTFASVLFVGFAIIAVHFLHVTEGKEEKSTRRYPFLEDANRPMREIYTASWAVEIAEGGDKMADKIASRYGFQNVGKIGGLSGVYHFQLSGLEKANLRTNSPYTVKSDALQSEPCVGFADQQVIKPRFAKSYMVPTDPLFQNQWNLLNSGQLGNEYKGNDLNVEKAWLQGLTGCNVTVAVVDDGLEFTHRDLWDNYAAQVSYDFVDEDLDPSNNNPWHGTSCGGIIGSVKDDLTCGVGIAYNSNLGGLALLGANSDMNEERSLTYENNIIDIYSNSWGPSDSGSIVEGPDRLTKLALQNGVREGREGKGSIFVWANGNGGLFDDCAADGYASSIYTISVGAIGVDSDPSPFDEPCSAKMVVTYVTNSRGASTVSTTALDGECTSSFGGTSAATPMASGIIALTLEANHNLTWRDVQYLIIYTSNPTLTNSVDSTLINGGIINGAGLQVSRKFGFGVMDAEAMVTRARHWINVPPQLEESVLPTTDSG